VDRSVTADEIARYRTVVFEGGDGVGKGTLAGLLVTHHDFTAVHSSRTPDHP
jgi:thymidylate kinase